jgi:hypothetical protein
MSNAIALPEVPALDSDARIEALESRVRDLETFVKIAVQSMQDQFEAVHATTGGFSALLAQQNEAMKQSQDVTQAVVDTLGGLLGDGASEGPSDDARAIGE